jgi:DNA modification methylase
LENRLNDLSGSQWLYWTNSIYETNFPPDKTHHFRKIHGAMKPPGLMAEVVAFFSKSGELILDPFAGVGGTLLGAELVGRTAVGIEINPDWFELYRKLSASFGAINGELIPVAGQGKDEQNLHSKMILGDCLEIIRSFPDNSFAAIITDPPYGCHHGPSGFKNETNFNMGAVDERDLGASKSFQDYLAKIKLFGVEAYRVLKPGRYLVLMIGDRFYHGEYLPLGTLVAQTLREVGFKWKGIRIWWNKATQRPLKPYAIKTCFIPNITHQNILILRKEEVPS